MRMPTYAGLAALLALAPLTAQRPAIVLERLGTFEARGAEFEQMIFDHSGARMLSIGRHGDVILWNTATWREIARGSAPGLYPQGWALHPTLPLIVVSVQDDSTKTGFEGHGTYLLDLSKGSVMRLVEGSCSGSAFDAAGRRLAALVRRGEEDALVTGPFDASNLAQPWQPHARPMAARRRGLFYDAQGERLCVTHGYMSGLHVILDARDPDTILDRGPGHLLGFDQRGEKILWDKGAFTLGGESIATVEYATKVASSPLTGHVAFLRGVGRAFDKQVWLADPRVRHVATITNGWYDSVAVSPTGTVVCGDASGQLHVYEGERHRVLGGHQGPATHLAFSADGRYVAAGGAGALVIAKRDGEIVEQRHGHHGVAPGEAGGEFWVFDNGGAKRWSVDAARDVGRYDFPEGWSVELARGLFDPSFRKSNSLLSDFCVIKGGQRFLLREASGPRCHSAALFDPERNVVEKIKTDAPADVSYALDTLQLARSEAIDQTALAQGTPPVSCGTFFVHTKYFGALRILDGDGHLVHEEFAASNVRAAIYTPSGRHLVTASGPSLRVLDTASFGVTTEIDTFAMRWLACLDETTLIGHDGTALRAFELPSLRPIVVGAELPRLTHDGEPVPLLAAATSPDGRFLAVSVGSTVAIYAVQ